MALARRSFIVSTLTITRRLSNTGNRAFRWWVGLPAYAKIRRHEWQRGWLESLLHSGKLTRRLHPDLRGHRAHDAYLMAAGIQLQDFAD